MWAETQALPGALYSSIDLALYALLISVFMVFSFKQCQSNDAVEPAAARWMANADEAVLALPLHRVALAGSHNSGSYAPRARSKCHSGDCDENLAKYLHLPPVSYVVKRWAKCQRISIYDQLLHGVRYLDVRVQIHDDCMHLCHSICFLDVEALLDQLVSFLDDHPLELVVVDVNHIYTTKHDDHARFLSLFLSRVGRSRVASSAAHTPSSSLAAFRAAGVQVVLIYHEAEAAANADVWGPSMIESVWPNEPTADAVLAHGKDQLLRDDDDAPRLRVLQMLPTPRNNDLTKHLSVLGFSRTMVRQTPGWLLQLVAAHDRALQRCNIVLMDDIVRHKNALVEALLEVNRIKMKARTVDITVADDAKA
ncbi:hypothetical protein ACHHYP_02784 [Achlya hypogyna]|uniref:Phosphatidylinositol-specific phospholipase C X domain-containing protein n=1 Tax=Achlya hypogyna TaxID=1202772 RepID=A0A1V9Z5F0_ACHHY|nr:hypothetical protein ACHHYP_02784 [Achlya hypogyna]